MSQSIDEATVRHIARLGRIRLSDEEIDRFRGQLESILRFFDKLQEIDTSNVEPLVHAIEVHNVLAADTEGPSLDREQALGNAAGEDGELFTVPRVLGSGS